MGCVLENKIPVWEVLQRKFSIGPGWCHLCKNGEDAIGHIFLDCPFISRVWEVCVEVVSVLGCWHGPSVEVAWSVWLSDPLNKPYKELPQILCCEVSLARNRGIFHDEVSNPSRVAAKSLAILSYFRQNKGIAPPRIIVKESPDRSVLWAYFDGASIDDGSRSGGWVRSSLVRYPLFSSQAWVGEWFQQFCRAFGLRKSIMLLITNGDFSHRGVRGLTPGG